MSQRNTTIQDDNLTFITYSANWRSTTNDPRYDGSNFHSTTQSGDTVSIKFDGTWIEVIGAKKPQYGTYSIELDGRPVLQASSQSSAESFRQSLFRISDLQDSDHVMRIVSTGSGFDVDAVTFSTQTPAAPSGSSNNTSVTVGIVFAIIGILALFVIVGLVWWMRRTKQQDRQLRERPYSETATLVQAQPYDYIAPYEIDALQRKSMSQVSFPAVPPMAYVPSTELSVNPPSTRSEADQKSESGHSHTSLPYLAGSQGHTQGYHAQSRHRSTTMGSNTTGSSISSVTHQPLLTNANPVEYVPEPRPTEVASTRQPRPTSVYAPRPLSIAGKPGTIANPQSTGALFDTRRVTALYATQPLIQEYSKRDTVYGKRRTDERRVDLLADGVPGSASATRDEFAFTDSRFTSPRPAPRPLPPPQPMGGRPPHKQALHKPALSINMQMLSAIPEPPGGSAPSTTVPQTAATDSDEKRSSISTIQFASTRPTSGITVTTRSNSMLQSPEQERESGRSRSTSTKKRVLRKSLPPMPKMPERVPEPEAESEALSPLAPPPTGRHRRGQGSVDSTQTLRNAAQLKYSFPFAAPASQAEDSPSNAFSFGQSPRQQPQRESTFGPYSPIIAPRPVARGIPNPPSSAGAGFSYANANPKSKLRMVDLEAGVVGLVEERRGWAKVRSMMGVMGNTVSEETTFEIVASPTKPNPNAGTGNVGRERTIRPLPKPLSLGGISNFDPPKPGYSAMRSDVLVTGGNVESAPPNRAKKMSILQSAVINGHASKAEVEMVTGLKLNV